MNKTKEELGELLHEEFKFSKDDIELLEVTEAEKAAGVKKIRIRVIKAGLSLNNNFYKADILEKLPPFVERRPKMFMDHDIFGGMFGRATKEWAATITKSWYEPKSTTVMADARLTANPSTAWLYEEMKQDPDSVGCSIDARVQAHEEEIDIGNGTKVNARVVDNWVTLNSVDFVTYAAAGGGIERVAASEAPFDLMKAIVQATIESLNHKPEETPMTLEELKKQHPDLVTAILKESQEAATTEVLSTEVTKLKAEVVEANKNLETSKGEKAALESKVTTLEEENRGLKVKVEAIEAEKALAAARKAVDDKLAEAVKAGSVKETAITVNFKNILYETAEREGGLEKVDKLIVDWVEAFKPLGVQDNGKRKPAATEGTVKLTDDQLAAQLKERR